MTHLIRLAFGLSLGACVAVVACGGATTDPGGFSSGLPESEKLGSLVDADVTQLCDALRGYLRTSLAAPLCKISAATAAQTALMDGRAPPSDADLQRTCSGAAAACEQRQGLGTCGIEKTNLACDATVHDFEGCVEEQIAAIESAASGVPACAGLRLEDLRAAFTEGGAPRAALRAPAGPLCTALGKRCPHIFGGGSTDREPTPAPADAGLESGVPNFGACGNGRVDPGEECDSFDGLTCASATLGMRSTGYVLCNDCHLDTTHCTAS